MSFLGAAAAAAVGVGALQLVEGLASRAVAKRLIRAESDRFLEQLREWRRWG